MAVAPARRQATESSGMRSRAGSYVRQGMALLQEAARLLVMPARWFVDPRALPCPGMGGAGVRRRAAMPWSCAARGYAALAEATHPRAVGAK